MMDREYRDGHAVYASSGHAVRSYRQIRDELRARHGIVVSTQRVQQTCLAAERKIREALAGWRPA